MKKLCCLWGSSQISE